ncbi:patatin-like phospholipase [Acanthamoeba polyphaga mimivirus]|uniref:Patatin-like phospholipase n=2 Tax=Megamimivirinae TaxID=3044648 RepID=A0A2L2DJS5_MIMIV|nr:putative patatin-like phospholipase [Megavirus chiliensis]AEQ33087.1 patatin-like phospholipase [Megavirus chiliensis]AVG46415.1 patatin-like phospholipase [Acanthamoeba polyphaga mimivirus]AVG47528.1 patatin-like phospholipase [Acanthamoeba polyphaga mimivirus]
MAKKIKNLSLCGGGFYGYAEIGALKELEKYKQFFEIENISGVSVGSIVAALYAVGYTIDEMTKIVFKMNFDDLIQDNYFTYYKLWEKFGMYDATKLEQEIERLIAEKTHIKLCTFSQIKINLTIISTNLNYQRAIYFNKINTPDMIISKAVRMSIGYPLVMTPVLFNGDLYGDGGEFINYPITMFKNLDETIGITFANNNENNDGTLKNRIQINTLYEYIVSIGTTMSRSAYIAQITPEYLARSIVINITENINSMQFNLTEDQKKFLFECGIKSVQEQINKIIDQ